MHCWMNYGSFSVHFRFSVKLLVLFATFCLSFFHFFSAVNIVCRLYSNCVFAMIEFWKGILPLVLISVNFFYSLSSVY